MFIKLSDRSLRWFAAGILLGAASIAALPGSASRVGDQGRLEPPARGSGEGHGSFCLIPEQGSYFYGRDFATRFRSYEQFAAWCHRYGGEVRWAE